MANLFDAANAPEGEPTNIVIGDFAQWRRSDFVSDYPSDSYSVQYVARDAKGSNHEIIIAGTGQSNHYLFTVLGSASDDYIAGHYYYQLEIIRTSDNERIVIDRGHFNVIADLDINKADPRTHAEVMLGKIESLLSGKADSDVASYSIAGRSLNKMSFEDLVNARNFYREEVKKELNDIDIKHGRKGSSTIQVRF